ncbi:hypothetical protein LLG46_09735 [bacterium]|nr:hypothetical protein [bacterium]
MAESEQQSNPELENSIQAARTINHIQRMIAINFQPHLFFYSVANPDYALYA